MGWPEAILDIFLTIGAVVAFGFFTDAIRINVGRK